MKILTEAEVEESLNFAKSCLAAAGHFTGAEADAATRAYLRGEITFEEGFQRGLAWIDRQR